MIASIEAHTSESMKYVLVGTAFMIYFGIAVSHKLSHFAYEYEQFLTFKTDVKISVYMHGQLPGHFDSWHAWRGDPSKDCDVTLRIRG